MAFKNLENQKFGKLTAIRPAGKDKQGRTIWLCRCECGNEKTVASRHLVNNRTTSCGCIRLAELKGKTVGELTVIKKIGENLKGDELWECMCSCGNKKTATRNSLLSKSVRSCGCLKDKTTGVTLERFNAENCVEGTNLKFLQNKTRKDNKTGHSGVYYEEKKDRWQAKIGFKGNYYHLGSFGSFDEALEARLKAERELHVPILEKYGREYHNQDA